MWEQLRTNASTPSTVIDPAGGQRGQGQSDAGAPRSKRRKTLDAASGGGAPSGRGPGQEHEETRADGLQLPRQRQLDIDELEEESAADDSGSNTD
jgi:hypothetical protein